MITQSYRLNLIPNEKDPPVVVRCSQYDKDSRTIKFSLYNGAQPFSLDSGYTVTVRGTKKDATAFEYNCSIENTDVLFPIAQQMTLFDGKYPCELRIVLGEEILGSANFILYVEKSPMDEDTVISDTDLSGYEQLLQNTQKQNIAEWLEKNITQETGYVIDTSLTVQGAAADAKAVGDAIAESGASAIISNPLKLALLQLASKVAYIDEDGQDYYTDLYNALYPLASITAVYTQSGIVYTTDTLNSLKTDLVVTAVYQDSSTEVLENTDYTLSGSLTAGTSTITVSYSGKTTTFNVTVTQSPWDYVWYAESGVAPIDVTTGSPSTIGEFVDGLWKVQHGKLCFAEVGPIECEIEFKCLSVSVKASTGTSQNSPAFSLCYSATSSAGNGYKAYVGNGSKLFTSIPGSNTDTNTTFPTGDTLLTFKGTAKSGSNGCTMNFAGLNLTGNGVSNNQYLKETSIYCSAHSENVPDSDIRIKSIKYKAVT